MKIYDFLIAKPARFFLLAAFVWGGLMNCLDLYDNMFSWHDLLVEANGLVLDLLVFGVLLSAYDSLRQKRERIERYQDDINDLRGWEDKEGVYRVVGAIRRLNKDKFSAIYLYKCFLPEADLNKLNLSGADLSYGILNRADLQDTNLNDTNLNCAELDHSDMRSVTLQRANLRYAKLQNARLEYANLKDAILCHADLSGADLSGADLSGADLRDADLNGANLSDLRKTDFENGITVIMPIKLTSVKVSLDWLDKLEQWKITGRQEIIRKYEIDAEGIICLRQ